MQHKKPKTGGRKKGTPNKVSTDVRQVLRELVQSEINTLQDAFNDLTPDKRVEYLIKLLAYVVPKPLAEINPPDNNKIEVVFVPGKTIL